MRDIERQHLLSLISSIISEFTIVGRSHYDDAEPAVGLRQTNELIHRLAGHLSDLCDPHVQFTESRSAAISAALDKLDDSSITRILRFVRS